MFVRDRVRTRTLSFIFRKEKHYEIYRRSEICVSFIEVGKGV